MADYRRSAGRQRESQYELDLGLYFNEGAYLSLASAREIDAHEARARDVLDDTARLLAFSLDMFNRLNALGSPGCEMYDQQAIAARQSMAETYHFLGLCRTHRGDPEGAIANFRQALTYNDDFLPARINLGSGLLEIGDVAQACEELERVAETERGDPEFNYYLGEAYRELRLMDEAQTAYERAITVFPVSDPIEQGGRWEEFAIRSVARRHDIFRWRRAIGDPGLVERDIARIERLAHGKPFYITVMQGRSILSHFVSQVEHFMRNLWLNGVRNPIVVVINTTKFPNPALVSMYGRVVWLVDDRYPRLRRRLIAAREILKSRGSPVAVDIDPFNPHPQIFSRFSRHQKAWLEAPQVIDFTDDERRRGEILMREIGIPEAAQYVCFGVREATYYAGPAQDILDSRYYWEANLVETRSHSRAEEAAKPEPSTNPVPMGRGREQTWLRGPIVNYLPMTGMLAERGVYSLRMGIVVDQPLPDGLDPRIIDYASHHRTDFGDIYLLAHSKFVVCGATGLNWINAVFGKPFVVTDLFIPQTTHINTSRGDAGGEEVPNLVLPRLYWYVPENRFLTFSEMFKTCRYYQFESYCQRDGIEHVNNTPEEITAVVDEMDRRIDGTWVADKDDEELQLRCRALLEPHDDGYGLPARFGAAFLRAHADLIR